MDRKFILTCGSTVDLPYDYCQQRDIPVIFYTYVLDGVEREDDMERNPGMLEKFYQAMREGAIPQTSQINTERYVDFFTEQLKHGDVLHIAFGSGMSASVNNAMNAARELDGKIHGHRMMVVDSLCSCGGYGLPDLVADLRDQGMGIEKAADWAVKNCGTHPSSVLLPAGSDLLPPQRAHVRRDGHHRHHSYPPDHAPERRRTHHCLR
ncbi:MAG: DegV family protein [Christensenellales bacterium]